MQSVITSLQEEQRIMTLLLALLKQEQLHLIAAEIDGLTEITTQKTLLVGQMNVLAGQRHSALAGAGFAAQDSAMQAWLNDSVHSSDGDHHASLWQDLLTLTREAKELNRLNGLLINKQMMHSQSGLNALRPGPQSSDMYGASGHASNVPTSRRFVLG